MQSPFTQTSSSSSSSSSPTSSSTNLIGYSTRIQSGLNEIRVCNNAGVSLLSKGQYENGIRMFQIALSVLNSTFKNPSKDIDDSNDIMLDDDDDLFMEMENNTNLDVSYQYVSIAPETSFFEVDSSSSSSRNNNNNYCNDNNNCNSARGCEYSAPSTTNATTVTDCSTSTTVTNLTNVTSTDATPCHRPQRRRRSSGNLSVLSGGYVFDKAIEIQDIQLEDPLLKVSSERLGKLPTIVIYNIALAYQLTAMNRFPEMTSKVPASSPVATAATTTTEMEERASILKKSLRLYELAYASHTEEQERQQQERMDDNSDEDVNMKNEQDDQQDILEIIVLMNNLTEIYKQLGKTAMVQKCNDQLMEALMVLVDNGNATSMLVHEEGELNGIFSNVFDTFFRIHHRQLVVTAAAA